MWTTADVPIPKDPFSMIIGQDEAVRIAKIVGKQRRNLLLVGPPGTGKSMIAMAIASLLPPPQQEISVLHNPKNPERPLLEVRTRQMLEAIGMRNAIEQKCEDIYTECWYCGLFSPLQYEVCPDCGRFKERRTPFDDLIVCEEERNKARTIELSLRKDKHFPGEQEKRKVIVPLNRKTFVSATGATETELLGDVRHDPYGGHHEIGTPPYQRVLPGAIHEAHEGLLFIDEIGTMGDVQRAILTALQEKKYPIMGRNPTSSGAAVRIDDVPCDFVLVAALNTNDLDSLHPALRSRITGNGYEVLMHTTMPDTEENRQKLIQFIAQEIVKDGKIPHASEDAVEAILKEAKLQARLIDGKANAFTLRLRRLAGIIRAAGDRAKMDDAALIEREHVVYAIQHVLPIEEQLTKRYDNWWYASLSDHAVKRTTVGSEVG